MTPPVPFPIKGDPNLPTLEIKMQEYVFQPKPTALNIKWTKMPVDIDMGMAAEDILIAAAQNEIYGRTGYLPDSDMERVTVEPFPVELDE